VRCSESPVKERDSYRDLSRYNAVPLVGLLGRRGRGTDGDRGRIDGG